MSKYDADTVDDSLESMEQILAKYDAERAELEQRVEKKRLAVELLTHIVQESEAVKDKLQP